MNTIAKCFYCKHAYGECECKFVGSFEWQDFVITDPNVSECGRFFVNPFEHYGEAYLKASANKEIVRLC